MRLGLGLLTLSAAASLATSAYSAPYLIVGNDEKPNGEWPKGDRASGLGSANIVVSASTMA
jgi:hypothetical protein